MKKDVLFYGILRPNRSPSQRYRIEQFFPTLDKQGITYDYSYLLNEKMDKALYSKGMYFAKILVVIRCVLKLFFDGIFKVKNYEFVFVERELIMLGTSFFEIMFSKKSKLIYDFDDALWLLNVSEANKKLAFLKNPDKIKEIISASHLVVAGNQYLAEYAKQFNNKTIIIPTCIDHNIYKRKDEYSEKENGRVCIGWSGSETTIEHFKLLEPVLKKLKERYGDKVYFKVIGTPNYSNEELEIKSIAWDAKTEIAELQEFDIGVMPLPEDKWAKGKCGLKALVYMSMGIPSVVQNVGVNSSLFENETCGYHINSNEEWFEKLSFLIDNYSFRKLLGENGRNQLVKEFSVAAHSQGFISLFKP